MKHLRSVVLLALAGLLAGCSAVSHSAVIPDYATAYRAKVKRIEIRVAPMPEGDAALAKLWQVIAQRYVNQHFNYLVESTSAGKKALVSQRCKAGQTDGDHPLDGVLWLRPSMKREGGEVHAAVSGWLLSCSDFAQVWSASASGTWDSADDELTQTIKDYVQQEGENVRPWVAPVFRLLKDTLGTLPNPKLNDADVDEKILLGA